MNNNGIKIKNIQSATLYGYNLGIRDKYESTKAVFNNSLFSLFLKKNKLNVYKESTRDIVCFEFNFGSRSFNEEMVHLTNMLNKATDEESKERINKLIEKVSSKANAYVKKDKSELREDFYVNNIKIKYEDGEEIEYAMLYRNPSKAKMGQVMFINVNLYDIAIDWLTMGLNKRMPYDNAKIVELSAYAPLTTSTIVDTINIPIDDVLILKDKESFYKTTVEMVKSDEYEEVVKVIDEEKTSKNKQIAIEKNNVYDNNEPRYNKAYKEKIVKKKKCVVNREEANVKNVIWDGMALIEGSILPEYANGMVLLRNHFFKTCAFNSNIQTFFKDYCLKNEIDYDTYEIEDMFGIKHKAKNIKLITTNKSIKWEKFMNLMGDNPKQAYMYWRKKVKADGCLFGIVKTDHKSKLGNVQQLSYQMVNTLPCDKESINEIAKTSVDYVENLKTDDKSFEQFLRQYSNEINHYEMLADLYKHNYEFANSKYFRQEKKEIISNYVRRLKKGKITVNGDNLTMCGNPYALLLYTVGADYTKDDTLTYEKGTIQCYTKRFNNGEYLAGFRNPHNSPNNICYFHNVYDDKFEKYFNFSENILAVNCLGTDVQDRLNGCDFDSDFCLVTNNPIIVNCAKECYEKYPTIVNGLNESGITYNYTKKEYARMDNKFSNAQRYIGESSNLAQLAMTYYWTNKYKGINNADTKELYDDMIILSVLAQVAIDGCKREYEVNVGDEIKRIKKQPCMTYNKKIVDEDNEKVIKCNLPKFMQVVKETPITKNGKALSQEVIKNNQDKLNAKINVEFECPMNWLQERLEKIQGAKKNNAINTSEFFIKLQGKPNNNQMVKTRQLVEEYSQYVKSNHQYFDTDAGLNDLIDKHNELIHEMKKIKIHNVYTINRLIETSLSLDTNVGSRSVHIRTNKYSRDILNILYKTNKEKFLVNFIKNSHL